DLIANAADRYSANEQYYDQAESIMHELKGIFTEILPKNLIEILNMMAQGNGPDVLSVSNLPIDSELPQDQDLDERVRNKTRVTEGALLGLAGFLNGQLQMEESSHQKGLIQQIFPVVNHAHEASGRGAASLPFHVENVFVPSPPSFLCLFCIRGEKGVETEYIFVEDIIKYLDKETIEQLKRPIYAICSGDGFENKTYKNASVIDDMGNGWVMSRFYEEDRIHTDDKAGQQAVSLLHDAICKARDHDLCSVELKPGTALIISNGLGRNRTAGVMHGRKGSITLSNPNSYAHATTPKTHSVVTPLSTNHVPRWLQRLCVEINYQ
ncbi:MAG: hypothetical protein MK137_02610, partial [Rickettsiales bacterium]|nr:hypothetical protein [Rickettsiales bacterium]